MGNNSSNPYPKYQFPYRQPVDFSWGSYIEFCSFFSELNINKNFQDNYRNRTIDLEGYITQLQKTSVKLLLNPSDAYSTNSEVTLHMKKEVLYSYGPDKFVLYQPVKFRGKFTSIGQIRNHQMELVKYDPNIRPELEITYEHFLSLFGSKAQKQADYYFNNYFRNRVIQVKGIVQGEIINMNYDQDVMKIPFHVINDNLFIPNEEVVLMIEKVQDPIQKQIFNRLKKLKYNTTVLLTVSIYSRGNPHVLKLISIDHVFTQDEQTKGQLVSVIGQTLMGGFNLWRNNKEKQEKMDQEKSRINNQAQQIKSIVKDNVEELKIQNEIEKQKMKEEVERMNSDFEISNISPVSELSPISDYPTNSPPSPSSSISDDSIDQYIQNDIRFQRRGNMQQGLGQQQIQQQSSSSQSSSSSQFSIPLNFNSLNTNNQMNQYERTMREEKEREIERERERRHVLDEGTDWAYNNNIDNNNTQQQMHIQQQSSSNDHPSQLPPSLMFSQQFGVLPIPSSFHQQQEQQYHPNIDPIDNSVGPIQNDSDVHQELTIDNYPSLHDLDVPNTFENEFIEGFICPITLELMTDPVLAEDGVYYEREAIVEWMKKKKQSPVTREVMTGKFFPDEALKKRIEEYRKLHPERANR
ncbi:MAG: hypothetical protein EZS28_001053 [Streblomastix strix]|uniref:U-box domain-containing protein n=1 Tax=Streblomastix strix TaxID=222440 RepID=A0A5J4XA59_9EUKA|nr:MAG: hypothetical protein EZS28_001053 [Streblomastix strix]